MGGLRKQVFGIKRLIGSHKVIISIVSVAIFSSVISDNYLSLHAKYFFNTRTKQLSNHLLSKFTTPTPKKTAIMLAATETYKPSDTPAHDISEALTGDPTVIISYPADGQLITFTSASQQFCVVDTPTGGDTANLQRKYNLNNSGWTDYELINNSLCLSPNEGINMIALQYKNDSGKESQAYMRKFTFHRISQPTITIRGQIYADINCDNIKDPDEKGIADVQVIIAQNKNGQLVTLGTVNADSDGNYTFSKTIQTSDSVKIQVIPNEPLGYVRHVNLPATVLDNNNASATIDIAEVPTEYIAQCH